MARRTRLAAVLTLAMINVFTLAAGITVARMLPPRLAALKVPTVAPKPVSQAEPGARPGNGTGDLPTGERAGVSPGRPAVRDRPRPPGVGRGRRPRHRQGPLVAERRTSSRRPPRPPSWSPPPPRSPRSAPAPRSPPRWCVAPRTTASSWSAAAIPLWRCTRSRPASTRARPRWPAWPPQPQPRSRPRARARSASATTPASTPAPNSPPAGPPPTSAPATSPRSALSRWTRAG